MEWIYFSIGLVLILLGFIGSFLPILPGPPLAYLGILIQQLQDKPPFSVFWVVVWGIVVVFITVLDYWLPVYGTKKFGGSKWGSRGSIIGLIIGALFLGPFGVIIGPFLGAYIGELYIGNNNSFALKSALGSLFGFLAGTLVKIITVFGLLVYLFIGLFKNLF